MEWKELLRQLKVLAWRVVELVVKLLTDQVVQRAEVEKLQLALKELTKLTEKLDQVVAASMIPGPGDKKSA